MCGDDIVVHVGINYDRKITVKCGNTSPTGAPWLCEECAELHKNRDWRREAEENGENYDSDY